MEVSGVSSEAIIQDRQKKIFDFLKQKWQWVSYILLAVVVYLAVWIRTRNIPGLKDVSTGDWTLGPDLDPFLFLRWAKYIVENGSLYAIDTLRNVPLGFNTTDELLLHPYMIAWFHKIASVFGSSSVTYSAVIYPVFFFAITVVAFYFFTSEIFKEKLANKSRVLISIVASLFLSIIPGILPRTIAGIPEKESAAFFFLFISFYLFIKSWRAKSMKSSLIFGALAGLFTAGMALVWGGFVYIYVVLSLTMFLAFFFGQVTNRRFGSYALWLFVASVVMGYFSTRYSLTNLFVSATTGFAFFVFSLICVHRIIIQTRSRWNVARFEKMFYSSEVFAFVATILIVLIFASAVFGPGFIWGKIGDISNDLIRPVNDRLGVTVAENKQPYFGEWAGNFGPTVRGFPVFFWLFFVGSIHLFYKIFNHFPKKEKIIVTLAYIIFLFSAIFSRYASGSILNGENTLSILLYGFGAISLIGSIGYVYVQEKKNNLDNFHLVDFGYLLALIFFFFGIVSARGSVRTIMMLIPPSSIVVAHFVHSGVKAVVETFSSKMRHSAFVLTVSAVVIFSAGFAAYSFYGSSVSVANSYVPSVYTNQWQSAMSWVRENTSEQAVFAHWWDYGYWIQSIGERATVLDGGNSLAYWNHLLGRYVLTGNDSQLALDFLYAHNATHLLIDSTDIGKYGAFSSIGSNVDYDRRSWIGTFGKDSANTRESKNKTTYVYTGGFSLDDDIIFEDSQNQTVLLPGAGKQQADKITSIAGLGAIFAEFDDAGNIQQPIGAYVFRSNQYRLPIRYASIGGQFIDFGQGIDAGVVFIPRVESGGIDSTGTAMYLSGRVVHSQLARLYLYREKNPYFKTVHSEDDPIVSQLRQQGIDVGNFIDYQGFRGPITIWEINYPKNMTLKEEYLQIDYPQHLRQT